MVDIVDAPGPIPNPEIASPPIAPEPPAAPEAAPNEPAAALIDSIRENHQEAPPLVGALTEVANTNVPGQEAAPAATPGDVDGTDPKTEANDETKKDEDTKDEKEEPSEEEKTMEDLKKKEAEYKKLLKELADLKTLRTLATDEKSQKIVDKQIGAKQAEIDALLGTVAQETPKGMSKGKLGLLILTGAAGILATAAAKGMEEAK